MATTVAIGGSGTLFVGEDKTLYFTLDEDMTGWGMLFDVRAKDNSPDPAILSKVPTVIGVWNATESLNTQKARVILTDDDLNLVKAKTYRWSWKRMDGDVETVLSRGPFAPEKATAP